MNKEIAEKLDRIKRSITPEEYRKQDREVISLDWTTLSVKDAMQIKNNLRVPISEEERKKISGVYPYYGPTRIQDYINKYNTEGEHVLIGEDGDHFLKYREKEMTLLVDGKFTVNNHAHILQGTDICTTKWFYYFFQHRNILNSLTRQGVGRYKLTKESLENLNINIPEVNEQNKITDILSTWDKAIELKEKLLEEKQKQKKGLMERLLTGKARLKGFRGKWDEVRISKILEEDKELEKAPELEKLISVKLHLQGVYKRQLLGNEEEGATTVYRRKKGQFIYGKQNFHNGAIGIIPDELDGFASSSDIPSFNFKRGYSPEYFYYYWARPYYYKKLEASTTGTGSKRLNPRDLLNILIKIPGYEEQCAVAKVIKCADKEICLLQKELEALKQQKKGLMQLLLTGIVRVKCD